MTKKILAILMALTFVLAFASCGKKSDDSTTASTNANDNEFANAFDDSDETDETEATEAASTDASATDASAADASATDATASTEATTAAAAKPSTTAEIVEYYNTAINNVKPAAKSIKVESIENKPAGSIQGLPSALSSIADSVIESNTGVDEDASGKTYTSAADKKANFPVENETYSSKLTADDVKSAKLTEKDGKYYIQIVTKADDASTSVTHGSGHAPKAFSVTMPSAINDNMPSAVTKLFSVGTASVGYPSSTIQVIVDKETGNVTYATYDLLWTMYIPLGSSTVIIPFETVAKYTIAW